MTIQEQYLRAELALPLPLAGVALPPFQLGHALLLERLHHPLYGGRPAGRGDLLLGAWICSRPATEAIAGVNGRFIRWHLRWLGFRLRRLPTPELHTRLARHITRGSQGPHLQLPEQKTEGRPGSPLLLVLQYNLISVWGCTRTEALNRPYAAARWDYAVWREAEGAVEIREHPPETSLERFHRLFPGRRPISAAEFHRHRAGRNRSVLSSNP